MQNPSASMLVIGDEILSGRTRDSNMHYLAIELTKVGIDLKEVRVISDLEVEIVQAVTQLSEKYDYVFTSGGIGPTHDDITALSISKAFKVKYAFNTEAYSILEKYYGKTNFNEGRKKMAKMPSGSVLIYNPSSAAPGFKIKNVLCLPGVPSILKSMINNLKKFLIKGTVVLSKSINILSVESNISKELDTIQNKFLKKVEIGSYPFFRLGKVGVSLVLRSTSIKQINLCKNVINKILKKKKIKLFKNS